MARIFRSIVFSVAATVACAAEPADPPAVLEPMLTNAETESFFSGEAVVRLSRGVVSLGESFDLECEVHCKGASGYIHNGMLAEHLKLPAQITITSTDGKVRRELLVASDSPPIGMEPSAWLRLWQGHTVGREFTIRIENAAVARSNGSSPVRSVNLGPGEYYIQAVYNHWLIALPVSSPTGPAERGQPLVLPWLSEAQMSRPLLISKPVKLRVVASHSDLTNVNMRTARPSHNSLHVELRPARTRAKYDRKTEVEVRMANRGDKTINVFNPQLIPIVEQRAVTLALLTTDGKEISDLLARVDGSWASAAKWNWVKMPPGGTVSSKAAFWAGATNSQFAASFPPGSYLLELTVNSPALSGAPIAVSDSRDKDGSADLRHPSWPEWLRSFPGEVICRSNRVELEILPRTGD